MSTKHFLNDPEKLVNAALESTTRLNSSVAFDPENKIVYLKPSSGESQVEIISGGGSGHEPAFAGFVGDGMLNAAVAGSIFASPSAAQVRRCLLKRLGGQKGVLVIIMNYTGDGLHFGMAVEKAKAAGMKIELLVVGDDVGVGRSRNGRIGRRGSRVPCWCKKLPEGALALDSLSDVHRVASLAASNCVSVGASLAHVHVPGRPAQSDAMTSSDEVEIGMGIHNEEGFTKVQIDLPGLVKTMLAQLLDQNDRDRFYLEINPGDSIILLINNLGGISPLEIGAITNEVCAQLDTVHSIRPYIIAQAGGDSVVDSTSKEDPYVRAKRRACKSRKDHFRKPNQSSQLKVNPQVVKTVLKAGLKRVIAAEPNVTKFDTIVGDGDCGVGLKRGAEAVLAYIDGSSFGEDAVRLLGEIAEVVEDNMDGTSGAIYAIFLNALTHSLAMQDQEKSTLVSAAMWAQALSGALQSLRKYTPAQPGDRTLVDALHPFVQAMVETGDLKQGARAAQKGTESTKAMRASLGRTVYIGGDAWKTCPDPGAYGLSEFLSGMSEA